MATSSPTTNQFYGREATLVYYPPLAKGSSPSTTLIGTSSIKAISGNGISMRGLRTQFKIERAICHVPSTADISITNLAESTRRQMVAKGGKIVLTGGYTGHTGQLFSGVVRTIDHIHEDENWVTRIQCGDGEEQFGYSIANLSIAPPAPVATVITAIANAMGLGLGNTNQILAANNSSWNGWVCGYHFQGLARNAMNKVVGTLGLEWAIQDGELRLDIPGKASSEPYYFLSPDTGLLGSPEHGSPDQRGIKSGMVKVKALLLPDIRPRRLIKLESDGLSGIMKVIRVVHTGDTEGPDYFTEMELRSPNDPFSAVG